MLDIARGKTKGGRHTAVAGIVAALAAPSAVIMGSDLLMVVAVLGFCTSVMLGRGEPKDDIVLFAAAAAAAITVICVPQTTGIVQIFLTLAFSCGCLSIAALTSGSKTGTSPDALDMGTI